MHVLMVTDAYPPLRTSCAVQMYDLGQVLVKEGHQVTVITPIHDLQEKIQIKEKNGVRVIHVRALKTKDVNYIFRVFAEFINPFLIGAKLTNNPVFLDATYDGIIWYSPTIFWGPLIKRFKKIFRVKSYLILRDIFPDWALDLGLLKKGLFYKFLKKVEYFQYRQADVIGVQSPKNLKYFIEQNSTIKAEIEVLWNWIGDSKETECSININSTHLQGRKILLYLGNMGKAQAMDNLISLAQLLAEDSSLGFLFVGRGSEVERLKNLVQKKKLTNILFFEEVPTSEIPSLCRQCDAGLVSLDSRHKGHNIPGKFLSYLKGNLPIIAFGNLSSDLHELIQTHNLGLYIDGDLLLSGEVEAADLINSIKKVLKGRVGGSLNEGENSINQLFKPHSAALQITKRFKK